MTQPLWTAPPTLRVDGDGLVSQLDDHWNDFVAAHRVGALRPAAAGTPFWEAVESGDTFSLYGVMLERARGRFRVAFDVRAVTRASVSRAELVLAPVLGDRNAAVQLSLRVLREQRRWSLDLFDPEAPRGHEEVQVCDFCQRVVGFDWVEPEVALRQLRIPEIGPQPRLHSSVCEDCERGIYAACHASRLRVG